MLFLVNHKLCLCYNKYEYVCDVHRFTVNCIVYSKLLSRVTNYVNIVYSKLLSQVTSLYYVNIVYMQQIVVTYKLQVYMMLI